ncbi:reverse transcriptase domain-containing protein, partial [Tanacetum coccineum]
SPRTNIVKTKTKICPVHGVAKRSTHLRGALASNARNWFSKLPRRSIDGFEELRRAFRLNFTQRKKCAKNPVELARVKQRQGESTSAYVERYKDECIHVKACPEILKISGFMNGINNPELIKRLNDRVPQTFDELMKRTRSFIQGEAAAADSRKGYSNNRSQEQSRRQSNDQSSSRNNSYHGQRGGRGNDKYTPLTMTPKEILATEGANFPRPPPMRTLEEQRMGNGYCEYHRQKGHTTNECVQLCQLIDKLVKEGRLDHLVKNSKETEINYSAMEKLILALVFATKRLRRYFQAHPIVVITDQPIKQVISKPDASGRLQKWSVLLGEHNISYRPRTAVKGQILADFLIEKLETNAVLP